MRISDWSSDVCSSDLPGLQFFHLVSRRSRHRLDSIELVTADKVEPAHGLAEAFAKRAFGFAPHPGQCADGAVHNLGEIRSEEHTSELQVLMRNSYAVFCLEKKKKKIPIPTHNV